MGDSKKVMLVMNEDLHRVLKALAASYDCTISELNTLAVEVLVHRLGLRWKVASEVFNWQSFALHAKVNKWCWGPCCLNCCHAKECALGAYEGTFVSEYPEHVFNLADDKAPGVPAYVDDKYVENPYPKAG